MPVLAQIKSDVNRWSNSLAQGTLPSLFEFVGTVSLLAWPNGLSGPLELAGGMPEINAMGLHDPK